MLILLLAAVLRLGWPGINSFAFDEARLSLIALDMARGGEFARVGMPASVGVPNLPAAAWVFSLPYLASPDPLIATQFVSLLSLGVVIGTWALARRVWGTWAGLTAALFLAASPYAVLYSRSIWAQNLLPLLGLLWSWTAYLGASRRSRWAIGAHIFLAGFAFQVHFAGAALILPTLYFFVRYRWWRHWLPALIGGGLALLALLPFVLEVACCRPDILDQYRAATSSSVQYNLLGLVQLEQVALGLNWGYLLLGDLQPPDSPLIAALVAVMLIAGIVSLVRMIVGARRTASTARSDSAILAEIVLVWLLASPLFFLRQTTPVLVHYHLAALPALALLVGAGTRLFQPQNVSVGAQRAAPGTQSHGDFLRSRAATESSSEGIPDGTRARHASPLQIRFRWSPAAMFIVTALVALVWSVALAQGLALAGRVETPNGLGTPLNFTRQAAYGVPDDAPVLLFTHGDDPNVDGEAAAFEALWWGHPHRIVQGESLLILPDQPTYLMATLSAIQAWEEIDAAGLAQNVQTFPRREGANPFLMTTYDGSADPAGFTLLEQPVQLADSAQLEGWKARRVGPRLRISTLWRVIDKPPAAMIQQFHHLRTVDTLDTEQPFKISDVPVSAYRWQVGDRLVIMGDFFVEEAGPFWVDVGHYTLPDVQRIARAGGEDGLVRLGPFESAPNS